MTSSGEGSVVDSADGSGKVVMVGPSVGSSGAAKGFASDDVVEDGDGGPVASGTSGMRAGSAGEGSKSRSRSSKNSVRCRARTAWVDGWGCGWDMVEVGNCARGHGGFGASVMDDGDGGQREWSYGDDGGCNRDGGRDGECKSRGGSERQSRE